MSDGNHEIPLKKQRHSFKPGVSGNPKGRPKGGRNRATLLCEQLMRDDAANVVRAVVKSAIEGDAASQKILMDRLVPVRKRVAPAIDLPTVDGLPGIVAALGVIVDGVARGELDLEAGGALAGLVDAKRKALETLELESRIAALEARGGEHGAS